jgi:hypothetical protein
MRWWAMCHCDDTQYVKVLQCYLKYGARHRERNDAIDEMLNLPMLSNGYTVDEIDEALASFYRA